MLKKIFLWFGTYIFTTAVLTYLFSNGSVTDDSHAMAFAGSVVLSIFVTPVAIYVWNTYH
jgi:hypothetical protein